MVRVPHEWVGRDPYAASNMLVELERLTLRAREALSDEV